MNQPLQELKIDSNVLQSHKLFIGTPMFGGSCGGMFARSIADLSALCTHNKIQLQLYFLFNESLITRARNYICDEFVRSGAQHLMFIDSDIGFDARDILGLLTLQIQNPDYDIIGGPYPKKCISWEKVKQAVDKGLGDVDPNDLGKYIGDFVFNPKGGTQQIPLYQPAEVLEVGTGFMMIRDTVFHKFKAAFPQYAYRPDHVRTVHFDGSREIMQYFQAEIDGVDWTSEYKKIIDDILVNSKPGEIINIEGDEIQTKLKDLQERANKKSKRYLSEDYWFSQKCQELNVKTFLCPWMKLSHTGTFVFAGSLADLAQAGATATANVDLLAKGKQIMQKSQGVM